jgi:hypothetical protein
MKSSKQMGRKKHYLAPETVDCEEYDEFSPSAPPSFTTGTIPLQYRESSHYLSECHASHIFFHLPNNTQKRKKTKIKSFRLSPFMMVSVSQ